MEEQQGSVGEVGSSGDLSSAIESISTEAPKLTGLDKLKAQKDFVEKNDAVPPKGAGVPAAKGVLPTVPVKTVPGAEKVPVTATLGVDGLPLPYTPDFKYKASGKELEIPEKFRALMVDKESEEEVKKLFGQAATLDEYKEKQAQTAKTLADTTGNLQKYQGGIQELRTLFNKNDLDGWFAKLNVPQEKIFQWVLDKVNYNQLPDAQRAQLDAQRNLQRQADTAKEQVGQASHREMQLATQVKGMQLEQTFGKTDVKSMADTFDSRVGKPGAFRDAIIEHGKSIWALSNGTVDLTPEQAVADFVKKYGNPSLFSGPSAVAGAAPQAQNTPQPSANAAPPVKVIPNVAGRSTSAVKQGPRSLDDLKRLRAQAIKEDNAQRSPSQGYLAG